MNNTTNIDSIDQILEKIKTAVSKEDTKFNSQTIENNITNTNKNSAVLELTDIVTKNQSSVNHTEENIDLIPEHVRNFTHKLNHLMQGNYVIPEKEVREIFKETLRPYLKSWLNNNLKDIVQEILTIEIQKILKKII